MQDASKLMLTVVAGGVLMGAALSQMASPEMQFAARPDWRQRYHADFSATPWQFSASLPEDLNPIDWTVGSMALPQPPLEASLPASYDDAHVEGPVIDEAVYRAGEDATDAAASLEEETATEAPRTEQSQDIYELPTTVDSSIPQLAANLAQ